MRRYEIDSIRSIALLLLIFYHIIISFIPETKAIFFIVNNQKDIVIDLLLVLSSALTFPIWPDNNQPEVNNNIQKTVDDEFLQLRSIFGIDGQFGVPSEFTIQQAEIERLR